MKHMEKLLQAGTSQLDDAPAPYPAPTLPSTAAKKTLVCLNLENDVAHICVESSDDDLGTASKDEMMIRFK